VMVYENGLHGTREKERRSAINYFDYD